MLTPHQLSVTFPQMPRRAYPTFLLLPGPSFWAIYNSVNRPEGFSAEPWPDACPLSSQPGQEKWGTLEDTSRRECCFYFNQELCIFIVVHGGKNARNNDLL